MTNIIQFIQIQKNNTSLLDIFKEAITIFSALIPIFLFIYIYFNFFIHSDEETKTIKLSGYNRKSINIRLILIIIPYIFIPLIIFLMFRIFKEFMHNPYFFIFSWVSIVLNIIFLIIIDSYFKKIQDRKKYFIENASKIIPIVFSFILSIMFFLSKSKNKFFTPENASVSLIIIVLLSIICIKFNYFLLKNKSNKIEIIFNKDIPESSQDKYKYENKIGFIISETNDDIVFEIDGILHRYRKSDIFCIKEVK